MTAPVVQVDENGPYVDVDGVRFMAHGDSPEFLRRASAALLALADHVSVGAR